MALCIALSSSATQANVSNSSWARQGAVRRTDYRIILSSSQTQRGEQHICCPGLWRVPLTHKSTTNNEHPWCCKALVYLLYPLPSDYFPNNPKWKYSYDSLFPFFSLQRMIKEMASLAEIFLAELLYLSIYIYINKYVLYMYVYIYISINICTYDIKILNYRNDIEM